MPAISVVLPVVIDLSAIAVQVYGENVTNTNPYSIDALGANLAAADLSGFFWYIQDASGANPNLVSFWTTLQAPPNDIGQVAITFEGLTGDRILDFVAHTNSLLNNYVLCSGSGFASDYSSLPSSAYNASSPMYKFANFYQAMLGRMAFDIFGHPLAQAGIENDTELMASMSAKDLGSLLYNAIAGLTESQIRLVYEQMIQQDISRFTRIPDVPRDGIAPVTTSSTFMVAGGSAAGGGAIVAYTIDGIEWTESTSGTSEFSFRCNHMAWNGTIWVGCGQGEMSLAYSTDGINWQSSRDATNLLSVARSAAWNGTMWVATGTGSTSIVHSSDGMNWTASANGTVVLDSGYSVCTNGSRWVVTGAAANGISNTLVYSDDGVIWLATNGSSVFSDICTTVSTNAMIWLAGGTTAGGGSTTIAYSYDGINWTPSSNGTTIITDTVKGFAWNGHIWAAFGIGGTGGSCIATSGTGTGWGGIPDVNTLFSDGQCNGVAWNGSRWVAVGTSATGHRIIYSTDVYANTWQASTSGDTIFPQNSSALCVASCYTLHNSTNVPITLTSDDGPQVNNGIREAIIPVNYPQSLKFETGDSITFEISLASSAVERGYQNHVAAATGPSTNVTEANQAPDTAGLNVTATTTKVYALNVTLS